MFYGLPYKSEDYTTALQLINEQWKINLQANFARERDRLEAIRVLYAAHLQAENGHKLDLRLLLDQLGGVFRPEEVTPEDEGSLHAVLLAQVRKPNYENIGSSQSEREFRNLAAPQFPENLGATIIIEF